MLFKQQSYLLRFVISVIEHCLRQTYIEDLFLGLLRCLSQLDYGKLGREKRDDLLLRMLCSKGRI